MRIKSKLKQVAVVLASLTFANQVLALQGGSDLTNTVKGYYPYLNSVGTQMISGYATVNLDGADRKLPKIGAIIEVPTYIDSNFPAELKKLYDYRDFDKDPDTTKLDDVVVRWYIVKPKGAKIFAPLGTTAAALLAGPDNWVKSWEDIIPSEEITGADLVRTSGNNKSYSLKVPSQAVFDGVSESTEDLRIGFTIVPKSEYGDPIEGHLLKAFDVSFLYSQTPPTEPGDPDPKNPDPGGPGGENPDNGGGPIQPGNPVEFLVYDTLNTPELEDDVLLGPKDFTKVRHTYRVQARKKVPATPPSTGSVYVDLTEAEEANLSWQLWDPSSITAPVLPTDIGSNGTNGLVVTFNKDSNPTPNGMDPTLYLDRFKQIDKTGTPVGDKPVAVVGEAKYTLFTTQDYNSDALGEHATNLSEQGLKIRVIYNDGAP